MSQNKKDNDRKANSLTAVEVVWFLYLPAAKWMLKAHGDKPSHAAERGVRCGILILSACYLEGFLVEALMTYRPKLDLSTTNGRILDAFFDKIKTFHLHELQKASKIIMGKAINDSIDKKLAEGFATLAKIRNNLVHAEQSETEIAAEPVTVGGKQVMAYRNVTLLGQYGEVMDYLHKEGVTNKLKDTTVIKHNTCRHFVKFVQDYVQAVLDIMPEDQKFILEMYVDMAKEIPMSKDEKIARILRHSSEPHTL